MSGKTTLFLSLVAAVPLVVFVHARSVRASEPPGRLVPNADGTVTDTVTQLTWQQATNSPTTSASSDALTCASFSTPALPSGWRLPTVKELFSIVDFESATSPMIDTAAFPGTATGYYLTQTTSGGGNFYDIDFAGGTLSNTGSIGLNGNSFRCVHSGTTGIDGGVP